MGMMSAAEFRENEITNSIALAHNGDTNPKHRQYYLSLLPAYTEPDYMDFAERYGDYVCDYEKRADSTRERG